jgi:hypothetical protein
VRAFSTFLVDLLLLAGAALLAWKFLLSFVAIETVAGGVTLALRIVEKRWQ